MAGLTDASFCVTLFLWHPYSLGIVSVILLLFKLMLAIKHAVKQLERCL